MAVEVLDPNSEKKGQNRCQIECQSICQKECYIECIYIYILYYIILYYIILYYIILYYIILIIELYNYITIYIYTSRWYVRNYVRIVCQGGDHSKKNMYYLRSDVFIGSSFFFNGFEWFSVAPFDTYQRSECAMYGNAL